jgi:hypothetical protein
LGFFIIFVDAFQSKALGFFVLSASISLKNPDNNQTAAEKTYGIPAGGAVKALQVSKSFFEIEFRASSACFTRGPAASSFVSVVDFFS